MKLLQNLLTIIGLTVVAIAGNLLTSNFHLPIPGSLVGMALVFIALYAKWIPLSAIESGSDLLIHHLLLFFIPSAIGIMHHPELFGWTGMLLLAATITSIIIVAYTVMLLSHYLLPKHQDGAQ